MFGPGSDKKENRFQAKCKILLMSDCNTLRRRAEDARAKCAECPSTPIHPDCAVQCPSTPIHPEPNFLLPSYPASASFFARQPAVAMYCRQYFAIFPQTRSCYSSVKPKKETNMAGKYEIVFVWFSESLFLETHFQCCQLTPQNSLRPARLSHAFLVLPA